MQKAHIFITFAVILFISGVKSAISQSHFPNSYSSVNIENDTLDALTYYDWVNSINNQNQDLKNRNQFAFKLDSAKTKFTDLLFNTIFKFTDSIDYVYSLEFNDDLNKWIPDGFAAYHYNDNLLTKQTYNNWDGNLDNISESNPILIRNYEYNELGQLIWYQGRNEYDIQNNKFSNLHFYNYDSLDRLIHIDQYHWFNGEDTIRHTTDFFYKYNEYDQLIESRYIIYNEDQSIQTRDSIYIYYLNNGKRDFENITVWTSGENLFGIWKRVYNYNSQGNPTEIPLYKKDTPLQNDWYLDGTHSYEYYNYGSMQSITHYDASNRILEKVEYNHDQSISKSDIKLGRNIEIIYPDNEFQKHMLVNSLEFLPSGWSPNELYVRREVEYFYSKIDTTSSIDLPIEKSKFKLIPNPTNNILNIEISEYPGQFNLLISNLQGQQVLSLQNYSGISIDVSHLKSGVYICTVKAGKETYTEKFVKL